MHSCTSGRMMIMTGHGLTSPLQTCYVSTMVDLIKQCSPAQYGNCAENGVGYLRGNFYSAGNGGGSY